VPGCATTVRTALNVFSRPDGQIRHAYCTELLLQMNDGDVDRTVAAQFYSLTI
jgi:hypothetical protein